MSRFIPFRAVVREDARGDATHIDADGDLDLTTFAVLDEQLRIHTRSGRPIRLDLSGVSYLDSAGVAALLLARDRATEHRVELLVTATSEAVHKTLHTLGLVDWLVSGGTRPDFLGALSRP